MKKAQPDVEFVNEQATPLGKIDAGSVVQALADAKPDAIFNVLFAADVAKLVREGNTRGLFLKTPVVSLLSGEPEYLDPLKDETPTGWIVTGYPWYSIQTPEHAAFLKAYQERFKDYPRLGSIIGYSSVMSMAAGMKKAGGADTEKLIAAFEGLKVDTPFGPIEYRAIDHQSTMGAYVGKLAQKDGKGIMVDYRYMNGADFLPSDEEVEKLRPARCFFFFFLPAVPETKGRRHLRRPGARFPDFLNERQCPTGPAVERPGRSLHPVPGRMRPVADNFGVTRIVNFAHGSLYMVGLYIAYSLTQTFGATGLGYWTGIALTAVAVGAFGALVEIVLLRRIYRSPELFQLLATFALVLIINDAALAALGARGLAGPARARPGRRRGDTWAGSFPPPPQPGADRHRSSRAACAVAAVDPHPLGHAGARRHAGYGKCWARWA